MLQTDGIEDAIVALADNAVSVPVESFPNTNVREYIIKRLRSAKGVVLTSVVNATKLSTDERTRLYRYTVAMDILNVNMKAVEGQKGSYEVGKDLDATLDDVTITVDDEPYVIRCQSFSYVGMFNPSGDKARGKSSSVGNVYHYKLVMFIHPMLSNFT
jgi:hypothetical protein